MARNEFLNIQQPYVQEEWVRNEEVAVTTTSKVLAEARPRKMVLVRNTSPNAIDIITVHLGAQVAVAGEGIVLNQNESFSDSSSGDNYQCFEGTITCVCATANGQVAIVER